MKWEFYDGAYSVRVHIMDDDGETIMMSAHNFPDEEEAQAFAELWEMSTTEQQRNLLWLIGNGMRRNSDPREIANKALVKKRIDEGYYRDRDEW